MPADQMRRFRLEWRTEQVHTRTFTLAELHEMAGRGRQILFEDGEPDVTALESMHDDGFFADITSEDTLVETPWSAMDRADEADPYERILDYGRAPAARRVTWHITAGDRTARAPAYAHAVAATPAAAVAFLRRACELMRERRLHLPPERTPGSGPTAEVPDVVLTVGSHAGCVFTDPVHGAEASALAGEIARDGGEAGVRVEISAGALADAGPPPPATR